MERQGRRGERSPAATTDVVGFNFSLKAHPMPPRIPVEADFTDLSPRLSLSVHWPSPRESTAAILVLCHGLGDSEGPFGNFARNMALPGVLSISVRGTSPLSGAMLGDEFLASSSQGPGHFHWGDDLVIDQSTGDLEEDPGFEKATSLVLDKLVKSTLIERCGWEMGDILLFGFGQGGSFALGLAARIAQGPGVEYLSEEGDKKAEDRALKGVVSIGGPLPISMVSTVSARGKARTPVLLCQLWDGDAVEFVKKEFTDVEVVQWKRREVAMPREREEMFPIMRFIAQRLRNGW